MAAGVTNNFILAILILFLTSLIWGGESLAPKVDAVMEGYPMAEAGIVKGDTIVAINNKKVSTWDEAQIVLYYKNKNDYTEFTIKHANGKTDNYKIVPIEEKREDGSKVKVYGININQDKNYGFLNSIKYSFAKFGSVVGSMWLTLAGLFIGKISIDALSGPVGIYTVVGQSASLGIYYIIYLIAYLSINVGIINIIPFPAFDGGHILFLIIEKIKGSPVNQKFENLCHTIGFILILLLILFVTINDVIRLF